MQPSAVETGVIHCEDNLLVLAGMPDECVDLIYLDPPFFSNRRYEVIWGDEAEVLSFVDRWKGGIREYIDWMRKRVVEMYRVLGPSGSLYLSRTVVRAPRRPVGAWCSPDSVATCGADCSVPLAA